MGSSFTRRNNLTRRRFLAGLLLGAPLVATADATFIEPEWVAIRRFNFSRATPKRRLVHFTDVHHKGDRKYLSSVVGKINALSPDLVCFTGDLIEEKDHLAEALEILGQIKSPLYGVPGNHDYWADVSFAPISACLARTGGAWLIDEVAQTSDGKIRVIGSSCTSSAKALPEPASGVQNILLVHYPAWVKKVRPALKYDLVLAGHSHGGQVRIPFFGPIVTAFGVDEYDLGLFDTPVGPLYVNPGIGWFYAPIRFRCRPELTVFDI